MRQGGGQDEDAHGGAVHAGVLHTGLARSCLPHAASDAGFDLMFRQGMELVTALATRLRQPARPDVTSLGEAADPRVHMALLTHALELNTALQLLRSAREGHLPAPIARREARALLHRLSGPDLPAEREHGGQDAPAGAPPIPALLRLPAHQLASLEATLRPHLALLATDDGEGARPGRP